MNHESKGENCDASLASLCWATHLRARCLPPAGGFLSLSLSSCPDSTSGREATWGGERRGAGNKPGHWDAQGGRAAAAAAKARRNAEAKAEAEAEEKRRKEQWQQWAAPSSMSKSSSEQEAPQILAAAAAAEGSSSSEQPPDDFSM